MSLNAKEPEAAKQPNVLNHSQQEKHTAVQMRRIADRAIAYILIGLTLPLFCLLATLIKLEGPGPVLERRSCIGLGGYRFQALKFRTSEYDPERVIPAWARKTTRMGHFLRYTRIEALPQLINVLRGEMSIIDRDPRSPSFLD